MNKDKYHDSIYTWKRGPRITNLSGSFDQLASGTDGVPKHKVLPLPEFFKDEYGLKTFYNTYEKYTGPFANHYMASIPYVLEEDCRIGNAILQYLGNLSGRASRLTTLQTIGTAEAVQARSIVALSDGRIISLSNSPTERNKEIFQSNCPEGSFFHLGPFFDIDSKFLKSQESLKPFSEGIDIIFEDTEFQMYSADREEQVGFTMGNLSQAGIYLALEKCIQMDMSEYLNRERQKDQDFKIKYFEKHQISKKQEILDKMIKGQVTFETLVVALNKYFNHIDLLWNCGNFYLLAASNNRVNLDEFHNYLSPPIIPPEFVYEKPSILV